MIEDDDLVGERDRGKTMRDDDRGASLHRLLKRESDAGLGRRVHRRGRVVEDEDAGSTGSARAIAMRCR